jgi:hypothetical protein
VVKIGDEFFTFIVDCKVSWTGSWGGRGGLYCCCMVWGGGVSVLAWRDRAVLHSCHG